MSGRLIVGGYYIVRPLPTPIGLGDGLLPENILTLSSCLTDVFPPWWALPSTQRSTEEQAAAIAELGLHEARLEPLMHLVNDSLRRGDLHWPCVWQSPQAAERALSLLHEGSVEFHVIELAVPVAARAGLLRELEPDPGLGACGLYTVLRANKEAEPVGVRLGWEVLGVEFGGDFHSWLCNGIHKIARDRLGIRPGALGLLQSEAEARSVVGLIDDGLGAEPVPWFAGLLSRVG